MAPRDADEMHEVLTGPALKDHIGRRAQRGRVVGVRWQVRQLK